MTAIPEQVIGRITKEGPSVVQRSNVLHHHAENLPDEMQAVELKITETYDLLQALEVYRDRLRRVAREVGVE